MTLEVEGDEDYYDDTVHRARLPFPTPIQLPTFNCDKCGKNYKYKQSLALHQRVFCNKEPTKKCPHCDKRCYRNRDLLIHEKTAHLDEFRKRFADGDPEFMAVNW